MLQPKKTKFRKMRNHPFLSVLPIPCATPFPIRPIALPITLVSKTTIKSPIYFIRV